MNGVNGPAANSRRVQLEPPGGHSQDGPTEAPPKGNGPIHTRIGRDPDGAYGAPPPRPKASGANELGPRRSSVEPAAPTADRPRVTFHLEANTVRYVPVADGAELNPVLRRPSPPPYVHAAAAARAQAQADAAVKAEAEAEVAAAAPKPVKSEAIARPTAAASPDDYEFVVPERKGLLTRLFGPRKPPDNN